MRYYHMIIESNATGERQEYISTRQGETPRGYKLVGICGYHDKPARVQKPCIGCVYYPVCGSSTRTTPCEGRKTKREVQRNEKIY